MENKKKWMEHSLHYCKHAPFFKIHNRGCQRYKRPQLFEFEVATRRKYRLRSKKAILEVATSNLQK